MGPLAFSSNAEPTYNLRFVSTRPPHSRSSLSRHYRFEIVLENCPDTLPGHAPGTNGQKVDFNLGQSRNQLYSLVPSSGCRHPITFHSFQQNVFSFNSDGVVARRWRRKLGYGDRGDPPATARATSTSLIDCLSAPARHSLRGRLLPMMTQVPIDAPRRAVWNPGIYFARLPFLPHWTCASKRQFRGLIEDFGPYHFFYQIAQYWTTSI